jgi:hypothetical protein
MLVWAKGDNDDDNNDNDDMVSDQPTSTLRS